MTIAQAIQNAIDRLEDFGRLDPATEIADLKLVLSRLRSRHRNVSEEEL